MKNSFKVIYITKMITVWQIINKIVEAIKVTTINILKVDQANFQKDNYSQDQQLS
jgi:hypothetical protein